MGSSDESLCINFLKNKSIYVKCQIKNHAKLNCSQRIYSKLHTHHLRKQFPFHSDVCISYYYGQLLGSRVVHYSPFRYVHWYQLTHKHLQGYPQQFQKVNTSFLPCSRLHPCLQRCCSQHLHSCSFWIRRSSWISLWRCSWLCDRSVDRRSNRWVYVDFISDEILLRYGILYFYGYDVFKYCWRYHDWCFFLIEITRLNSSRWYGQLLLHLWNWKRWCNFSFI